MSEEMQLPYEVVHALGEFIKVRWSEKAISGLGDISMQLRLLLMQPQYLRNPIFKPET